MPPKPNDAKQKKEKKNKTIPLDDVDTTTLTQEKLQQFCVNVYAELVKEEQHCNFLRLERDKLANMVEIAHEQLVFAKQENYERQRELDEVGDKHRLIMKQKREQLMNFKIEKNIDSLDMKLRCVQDREIQQENHQKRMDGITSDINNLKSNFVGLNDTFYAAKIKEDIEHAEQKYKLRLEEQNKHILIEHKWDRKVNNKLTLLSDKFKLESERLNNKKANEATQLIKSSDKFRHDLEHYYKNIVYHNLNLTRKLNSDLQELKDTNGVVEKDLVRHRSINESLKQDLVSLEKEKLTLQEILTTSAKDKEELVKTRKELSRRNAALEDLKIELEALNIAVANQNEMFDTMKREEDSELVSLKASVEEVILVMEYMAFHLRHKVDELNSMLSRVASDIKGKIRSQIYAQLPTDPPHPAKDFLTWDLTSVAHQHDQILQRYHQLLQKYGIHPDNTGFTPLIAEEILKRAKHLKVKVTEVS